MNLTIRRAQDKDADRMLVLLGQVLEVHAKIRPDIFISGSTKYRREDLFGMFRDESRIILAAVDERDVLQGYAVCELQRQPFGTTMKDFTTLYIDDLCVDEACRGQHIGKMLYEAVLETARGMGCYDVTLNVWEGNDAARAFYEAMGMGIKETTMEVIL